MELVRRNFYFDGFIHYAGPGFIIAILVILLGFLIGAVSWDAYWNPRREESKLYAALRGEEWVGEADLKNAEILRGIYAGQYPKGEELLKFFSEGEEWFARASEHLGNVDLILSNFPEASEIDVHIEPDSTFLILTGFASFLFLAAATSFSFWISSYNYMDRQSLLYPWNKIWSYPLLVFMFPYVLITQPILLIRYGFRKLFGSEETQINRADNYDNWIRSRTDIDCDRKRAEERIAKVLARRERHKVAWRQIYARRLPLLRQEVESRVRSTRLRLSDLGSQIEQTQRVLAEECAKLKELECADGALNEKREKDSELEFERLLEISGVRAVEVNGDEICVYTDTIFIRYKMTDYEIGVFSIQINAGLDPSLKIKNLCNTSNYKKRIHPYGFDNEERFCFGDLSEYIYSLLKNREYAPMVAVILQALRSADGDSPSRVMYWRRV